MELEQQTLEENELFVDEPEIKIGRKTLKVVHTKGTHLYRIKNLTGGELPDYLTGRFTSANEALKMINKYIRERADGTRRVRNKDTE